MNDMGTVSLDLGSQPLGAMRKKPRRLTEELVDALTEQIRNNGLHPGDKLPPETQIMIEHGVSRTVVREAICGLQAAGLVETKHGIGTFVLDAPVMFDFRVEPKSIPTVRDTLAMLELRISLECRAAALAASRRAEGHLERMRLALDGFLAAVDNGGDTAQFDFQFHFRVAEATGNRYFSEVLSGFGMTYLPRVRIMFHLSADERAAYQRTLSREHKQVYEAILRADPRGASKSMGIHLSNSCRRLQSVQDELDGHSVES
jgi:DNA-binding FadR family transcriptional regulator